MNSQYTKEQKDLMSKPIIHIMPAFNGEWVIEVYTVAGELMGRFNATDTDVLLDVIKVAVKDDSPPHLEVS